MNKDELKFSNYCVSFIDLLGQKDALSGEGLLPDFSKQEDYDAFVSKAKKSIGSIASLQTRATEFSSSSTPFPNKHKLSKEEQILIKEISRVRPKQQKWSDGLVYFSSLQQETNNCPMNAVFEMFILTGTLCFLGLASKQPIRGAIEVSWGVELNDGEIYGPALAKAYELENTVAQYPRIVIGELAYDYLQSSLKETPNTEDKLAFYNRNLATMCLDMTAIDNDGHYILDYLGTAFTNAVTHNSNTELFKQAYQFISSQYQEHKKNKNSKLSMRYAWLIGYFHMYKKIHTSQ